METDTVLKVHLKNGNLKAEKFYYGAVCKSKKKVTDLSRISHRIRIKLG